MRLVLVVLLAVWLCGVAMVLLVWLARWRQVARTLRRAARAESGREVAVLRRVEAAMGGRIPLRPGIPLMLSRELMEPGIFGVFRPVLVWPERLSERLDDEHIAAILMHELMHARRRDNLTAALHMLVEAAFWFHPMVWWMGRRMVEERERACDEAVIAMGSRPGVYAESLLKAVRFCVESPLACVAGITGADLNRRVRSIMTLRMERMTWPKKLLLVAAAVCMAAVPIVLGQAAADAATKAYAPAKPLSFDVVSVRQNKSGSTAMTRQSSAYSDGITMRNVPPFLMVCYAYHINDPNLIKGMPDWAMTERYDLIAKVDPSDVPAYQKLTSTQRGAMMQKVLADRFGLQAHRETKDSPVYALVVAKGGAKLKAAEPGNPYPKSLKANNNGFAHGGRIFTTGDGQFTGRGATTADIAMLLSNLDTVSLGRVVVDKTGLTGKYDFTLQVVLDQSQAEGADRQQAIGSAILTALREQLGLKLVAAKGPMEVIVIDHIERPSPN